MDEKNQNLDTHPRALMCVTIAARMRAVGAFITGGVAQANRYARAEALANAAESHLLDALRGGDAQCRTREKLFTDCAPWGEEILPSRSAHSSTLPSPHKVGTHALLNIPHPE